MFSFRKKENLTDLDDLVLLTRFRESGDLGTLGILYDRYMHLVFGVCMKYLKNEEEAKDAVMQLFEKLVETLPKHEVANFKSWLHVTARNHCLMALRAKKAGSAKEQREIPLDDVVEYGLPLHHEEESSSREEELQLLERVLDELKPEQQTCVRLFYLEQRSYQEVADSTGYDLKKVKSYIQNGKRNLRMLMEKEYEQG